MKRRFWIGVMAIVGKDLRAEMRSRELLSVMGLFALLSVLVFSFALELDRVAREEAVSGVLWVTLIFASLLGFNRSLSQEYDGGGLDALLLSPISRSAIYVGKLLGNYVFTLMVALALLPLMSVVYNKPMLDGWLILTTIIGMFGFCAIGTLLATLTLQTRMREALLPIALLPLALPLLLTSVRASAGLLRAAPMADWQVWLQLLLAVSLIYFALCWLLYGYVLEE